jgi:hypothetical protein
MGSATIGPGLTDFTRYHTLRNALWILAKDMPARALLDHRNELVLGQRQQLEAAIRDHKLAVWLRAWRDALRGLPRALRKRRAVQEKSRIDVRELDSVVGAHGGVDTQGYAACGQERLSA